MKWILSFCLLLFSCSLFSQNKATERIYGLSRVDTPALFIASDCENLPLQEEKKCMENALFHFMNSSINYQPRNCGVEGIMVIEIIIEKDGTVQEAKILKSNWAKDIEQQAIEAGQKLQFKPAMLNGKPVRMRYNIPIRIRIKSQ